MPRIFDDPYSAWMADDAIEVQGLRKRFGDVQALCGIDLSAPPGTILGLLGPNAASRASTRPWTRT
jgi:ABC-2 type transport system ATP-binding protein